MQSDTSTNGALQYTGERFHPELMGEIRQEHIHRYAWSRTFVEGKDVLDVASGEGFGSDMLAQHARAVVGVDISEAAIAHASSRYKRENLSFERGSATALPFNDGSFDVVFSFETIEHVEEQALMIRELRRVLRNDGILIISSPNVDVYTVKQEHLNEFHLHEMNKSEFLGVLGSEFSNIEFFNQRQAVFSSIHPDGEATETAELLIDDGQGVGAGAKLPDVMYYIAVASNDGQFRATKASMLGSSAYDVYWDLRDETKKLKKTLSDTVAELQTTRSQLSRLKQLEYIPNILESGLFDFEYYTSRSGAVHREPLIALVDYLLRGEAAGYPPSSRFDPAYYEQTNWDVISSGMSPLVHFVLSGQKEGRMPTRPA